MDEIDRITEDGKKAIVAMLQKGLATEYTHLVNYPRMIDQMLNIEHMPEDDPSVITLESLGEDSIRHVNVVMRLSAQLGGEPRLVVEPVERISDVLAICQHQMENEKENLLQFEQALTIAQANPVKKAKGIIEENIRILRDKSSDMVQRSNVIEQLKVLAEDEKRHIKMLTLVILDLDERRRKSEY